MNKKDKAIIDYIRCSVPDINKTKLNKYLYAIELAFVARYKRRLTNIEIVHYNYGPYSEEVSREDIAQTGYASILSYEKCFMDEIINRWKNRPFEKGLLNYVYNTIPFVYTPFGKAIDFLLFKDEPDLDKVLIKNEQYKKLRDKVIKYKDTYDYLVSDEFFSSAEKNSE